MEPTAWRVRQGGESRTLSRLLNATPVRKLEGEAKANASG